jgi:hypothetical protein
MSPSRPGRGGRPQQDACRVEGADSAQLPYGPQGHEVFSLRCHAGPCTRIRAIDRAVRLLLPPAQLRRPDGPSGCVSRTAAGADWAGYEDGGICLVRRGGAASGALSEWSVSSKPVMPPAATSPPGVTERERIWEGPAPQFRVEHSEKCLEFPARRGGKQYHHPLQQVPGLGYVFQAVGRARAHSVRDLEIPAWPGEEPPAPVQGCLSGTGPHVFSVCLPLGPAHSGGCPRRQPVDPVRLVQCVELGVRGAQCARPPTRHGPFGQRSSCRHLATETRRGAVGVGWEEPGTKVRQVSPEHEGSLHWCASFFKPDIFWNQGTP